MWLALAALVIAGLVLTTTPVGRHVYAIGVNREAAFLSGVRVRQVPLVVFVLSGAAAAFAGVVTVARLNSAPAGQLGWVSSSRSSRPSCSAASPSRRGGRDVRRRFGVLFLGMLRNGLTLLGVTTFWQSVASGVALVAAIAIAKGTHVVRQRLEARAARTSSGGSA